MDAITLLKEDHATVSKLFSGFDDLGDNAHEQKRKVVDEIIRELSIHAAIEEAVLYPTIRTVAKSGNTVLDDQVLESLEEHHVVKWLLDELDGMDPKHERFDAKVTVLKETVEHHVDEEEDEMFPRLRDALDRKTLDELGTLLDKAKAVAPTHPHPHAPDEPPGNVTALVAGFLDRVRDAVRGRPAGASTSLSDVTAAAKELGARPVQAAAKAAKKATKKTTKKATKKATTAKRTAKKATKKAAKKATTAKRTVKKTARKAAKKAGPAKRAGAKRSTKKAARKKATTRR
jgi:hemerythrin superfamily protein